MKILEVQENEKPMYQELSDEICINKEGRFEVNLPLKILDLVSPDKYDNVKNELNENSIN